MGQVNTQIDPLTTNGVLAHLGLAIDEIKLLRAIDRLKEQVRLSDTLQIDADRRQYLVAELRYLNRRLSILRQRASSEGCREGIATRADRGI